MELWNTACYYTEGTMQQDTPLSRPSIPEQNPRTPPSGLSFPSQLACEFPESRLLQHLHPIHWTLKATSPTLPQALLSMHPQPKWNSEAQPAITQKIPRGEWWPAQQDNLSRNSILGQNSGPKHYLLQFMWQPTGKFPPGVLLKHPHTIHQTLKATSLTPPPKPPMLPPSPLQLQRNIKTQDAASQGGPRQGPWSTSCDCTDWTKRVTQKCRTKEQAKRECKDRPQWHWLSETQSWPRTGRKDKNNHFKNWTKRQRQCWYQLKDEMGRCQCKNSSNNIESNMVTPEPSGHTTGRCNHTKY